MLEQDTITMINCYHVLYMGWIWWQRILMILPCTQPNSTSMVAILCFWESIACNSLPLSFLCKLVRGNLCTPSLNKKWWTDCSRRDLVNTSATCKEERRKQDLLSYEVHLNYHIAIREVLKVVCQYHIGEKWATLIPQHLKKEIDTQLLYLT